MRQRYKGGSRSANLLTKIFNFLVKYFKYYLYSDKTTLTKEGQFNDTNLSKAFNARPDINASSASAMQSINDICGLIQCIAIPALTVTASICAFVPVPLSIDIKITPASSTVSPPKSDSCVNCCLPTCCGDKVTSSVFILSLKSPVKLTSS